MITKINVPKTSIVIEIEKKEIKIENLIDYDIKMIFRNQDAEPSLDETEMSLNHFTGLTSRQNQSKKSSITAAWASRKKNEDLRNYKSSSNTLKRTSEIFLIFAD